METVNAAKEPNHLIGNFLNNVLTDLKNLTNALKALSKPASDVNNALINKLLLANDEDLLSLIKDMLSHMLHVVDLKGIHPLILSVLTKVIASIKTLEQSEHKHKTHIFEQEYYRQGMTTILYHVIDIVCLLKNRYRQADMTLRIIQTTYSLIDCNLLQFADYTLFTRIYSICFDCCLSNSIIQNISASALFALTEIVFASHQTEDSLSILTQLMDYLLGNRKFAWIKGEELKGMVWDLVIIAVRNFPEGQLEQLGRNKKIGELMNKMYSSSIEQVFGQTEESHPQQPKKGQKKLENERSINFKKGVLADFIRFYKCFIYFSIHLALRTQDHSELVPFKDSLVLFKSLYDLERNNKLYIFLEGVSLLLIQGTDLLVEEEKGIVLLDVFTKTAQELCLASVSIEFNWEGGDFYLDKMCGDFSKINDADFVKLIKNTIIKLRKQFQAKTNGKTSNGQLLSARSDCSNDPDLPGKLSTSLKKRWQRLIASVIRIIRYLTSLNLKQSSNDQVIRKLIIELQYWFLICPSNKARNMILQELLNTSSLIDNKLQAIKVSQCLQLGSNIIFAYSDSLDNVGLAMLVKMLATVKTSWEEGRGFDQLEEVCLMADKLYTEQNIITSTESFHKTIQAFVQCANSLLADMEQPITNEDKTKKVGRSPQDKLIKMIDFVLGKLRAVLQHNPTYVTHQWNFLTGFWISFCSNRNEEVRSRTMNHLESLFPLLLKLDAVKQQEILSPYFQLAKLHLPALSKLMIAHIKQLLVRLTSESAIVEVFAIIKIILESHEPACQQDIYELQEMLIKESIFQVKSPQRLVAIIDCVVFISKDKNEEYKTVSLVWNIADHLKALALTEQIQHSDDLWRHLFAKIYALALHSTHSQTKQTCIHAFTQMLAQSTHLLAPPLFFLILRDTFLELFTLLMGAQPQALPLENSCQVEMAHVAVKNYAKIIRKCQLEKVTDTHQLIELSVQRILAFVTSKGRQISIEYYYELCLLLEFWSTVKPTEDIQHFNPEDINKLLLEIEKNHEFIDRTSLLWRKKYEPKFLQIRKLFITQ